MITIALALALALVTTGLDVPFATAVVEYAPAAGQFAQNPAYNDPSDALGPPVGAGVSDGNTTSVVTLGGFGGSITLAFDHPVEDDPLNPFGMDAIVFGNAFWVGGNPHRHWAECAAIEISHDSNGNGLADDRWFLIPGSHYASTDWTGDQLVLPADVFGSSVIVNGPSMPDAEAVWGYAEYSPTLRLGDMDADNVVDDTEITHAEFYTVADDPFIVGISHGTGGGDAFDIAWAIDPLTGKSANLDAFDFIRITTAVQSALGPLGEKSAEIDAVADVTPDYSGDLDGDLDLDLLDVAEAFECMAAALGADCGGLDKDGDGQLALPELVVLISRVTGPQ